MSSKLILCLLLVLWAGVFRAFSATAVDDLQQVSQQLREYLWEHGMTRSDGSNTSALVDNHLRSQRDGAWPDINYNDPSRGHWNALEHVKRVEILTLAYTNPKGSLFHNAELGQAIHSALGYWFTHDFQSKNWWNNIIGAPSGVGKILILLDKEVTPEERTMGLKILGRNGGREWTGQNRVWVNVNALMKGLLENDAAAVMTARDVIASEIQITTSEGLQPDFSFHQHGSQLQLGNYGLAYADTAVQWIEVLRDTRFAVDAARVGIIRDFLLNGESTVVWNGAMDISSCGRQLFPETPRNKGGVVKRSLEKMKKGDAPHADDYTAALTAISQPNQQSPVNRYFWRSDYMVHRRNGFCVTTKMNSPRVKPGESINQENLLGTHLTDGATYLYRANEYTDIFPVWDWSRIPGVTCLQSTKKELKFNSESSTRPFVGGVSDGRNGMAAFDFSRDGVTARKSWFYFDDAVVCLGAGISSADKTHPLRTSIQQCLAKDAEWKSSDASSETPQSAGAWKWIHYDGAGYLFPEGTDITVQIEKQSGLWNDVYEVTDRTKITKPVFSLWINHGLAPTAGHYAYALLPNVTEEQTRATSASPAFSILSNTSTLQAMRSKELLFAAFYQAGTLSAGELSLAVTEPCLVMIRSGNDPEPQVWVSDPTQKLKNATITFNGTTRTVSFPKGGQAGRSTQVK